MQISLCCNKITYNKIEQLYSDIMRNKNKLFVVYFRSKSNLSMDKYVREKRIDNYRNQSSSRPLSRSPSRSPSEFSFRSSKNDPNKSSKRNDRVTGYHIPNLPVNYTTPYSIYNNYVSTAGFNV